MILGRSLTLRGRLFAWFAFLALAPAAAFAADPPPQPPAGAIAQGGGELLPQMAMVDDQLAKTGGGQPFDMVKDQRLAAGLQ